MIVLKESVVTDSFLNLDKKERGCQNEETYANCTTRLYIDAMVNKCGCLSLTMSLNERVREAFKKKKTKKVKFF